MLPEEPNTRIERYLAKLSGQDVAIPDHPTTRIECYLDYLVKNGGGGGGGGMVPTDTAGAHNSIFRGKLLGAALTEDQAEAISSGTFDDIYVGDYWAINGFNYRVAGLDLFLHMGDVEFTKHHAVIVPDTGLYKALMNAEATTAGGYAGSLMKTDRLSRALEMAKEAFGASHVLTRRSLLCTAVTAGIPSSWAWTDTSIDLMTEGQVFGRGTWGVHTATGFNIGERYGAFPLFTISPGFITTRVRYWLQDVVTANNFSSVAESGSATSSSASSGVDVRPYFCIGKVS